MQCTSVVVVAINFSCIFMYLTKAYLKLIALGKRTNYVPEAACFVMHLDFNISDTVKMVAFLHALTSPILSLYGELLFIQCCNTAE